MTTERLDAPPVAPRPDPPPREESGQPPAWKRWLASVRVRIVAWHLVVVALALLVSILAVRLVLLARVDERIDRELVQEVEELRTLAGGLDPETGEPFADAVDRLFEVFLQRNIPARNETMLTYVDGRPFRRSAQEVAFRLDLRPELTERWASITEPQRGVLQLDGQHEVTYMAVPVSDGDDTRGVFVVAYDRGRELEEVDQVVLVAAVVGVFALLLAAGVTWNVASRVLAPVRAVTGTARRITETDIAERIEVDRGADEVSMLARTFNDMLDRLEAAFESQRAFIDDAGHELRTPITIIRGHLELLDHGDPGERAETVALVLDELDRMHRMVEELLLLAKAQRPDFLRPSPLDVTALTEELAGKARGLADRDWRIDARGQGTVLADRQRLTEAMMELAENATRHTGTGDVVALGSAVVDGVARFWVRDEGPGVAPEERDAVFERFHRGAYGRGNDASAGLGLAIVRAIAEAHRGTVELDDPPNGGARFTITVPVAEDGGRD